MTIMYLSIARQYSLPESEEKRSTSPSRSLIIPKIPAMLETLLPLSSAPSLRRMPPVGRSMIRVGVEGDDGDVNA